MPPDSPAPLPSEPMDPQLTSIQPGGGFVMRLEQAWGRLRRGYLKRFRGGYLRQMEQLRKGDQNPCPHEVLDPRDLKFHRNQPGAWYWDSKDDPFTWRDWLPFARVGLAELLLFSTLSFGTAAVLAALIVWLNWTGWLAIASWIVVAALAVIGLLVVWFFRDPSRTIPQEEGVVVAPADGLISSIDEIEHDEFIGGPAVQIGIFLSIFNVHINRVPMATQVVGLTYQPGKFLNALLAASARENEQLVVRLQQNRAPYRRMIVRQIAGAIARRIVCWLKPGDELACGDQFGMIKFGSRTELVLPRDSTLTLTVQKSEMVKAGSTIVARYGQ